MFLNIMIVLINYRYKLSVLNWILQLGINDTWYFVYQIILTFCENFFFKFLVFSLEFQKFFLITISTYMQQWKVKTVIENIFFDLFLDISQVSCIRKIRIHIRNEMGFRNLQKKCLCFDLGILWRGFSARFSNWSQGKQSESNIKE